MQINKNKIFYADVHVHTEASHDSDAKVERLLEYAVKNNVSLLAITDHVDMEMYSQHDFFERMDKSYNSARDYEKKAEEMGVKLCAGVELGQSVIDSSIAEDLCRRHDYDFILMSQHNAYDMSELHVMDPVRLRREKHEILDGYFDNLLTMIGFNIGDCLSHITYPIRYMYQRNIEFNINNYMPKIEEILKAVISRNMAIEVNTSGMRRVEKEPQPSIDIIKMYYEMGGRLITLGSDTHREPDLGKGIAEAHAFLKEIGFTHAHYYIRHKPVSYEL